MDVSRNWREYECPNDHRWWSAPLSTHCPVCGTSTITTIAIHNYEMIGGVGPGTPAARMHMVWEWIHEQGAGREEVLEELCPGWSILSSKMTSEQALMTAFDELVARNPWLRCGAINRDQMVRKECVLSRAHMDDHRAKDGERWPRS